MKKIIKRGIIAATSSVLLAAPLLTPTIANADTASQTVQAVVAKVIYNFTTGGTVNINITPVSGGAQTSASDTVHVGTNDPSGYTLKIGDGNGNADLANGGNTIGPDSTTFAAPGALANLKWGYAVPGAGTFDASYSTLLNVTSSASKWAGMPLAGADQTIKTTATTAANDTTDIWYSAKADLTLVPGTYTDTVTYTALVN